MIEAQPDPQSLPTMEPAVSTTPVSTTEEIPAEPTSPPSPSKFKLGLALFGLLLIVVGAAGWYLMQSAPTALTPSPSPTATPTESSDPSISSTTELVTGTPMTVAGYSFIIPQAWSVQLNSQTKELFLGKLYPESGVTTNVIEVQASSANNLTANPLLKFTTQTQRQINGLSYVYKEGSETLLGSTRTVWQAEFAIQNKPLIITMYATADKTAAMQRAYEQLLNTVSAGVPGQSEAPAKAPISWWRIPQAHAQGSATGSTTQLASPRPASPAAIAKIAGFEPRDFEEVSIMEGPYPGKITAQDRPYKDGYARLYTFQAIKGQRIHVLAEEEKPSFIRSELYDQTGKLLVSADTRLEVPYEQYQNYTGRYYVIVHSFEKKQGNFLFKVFDLDQVQTLFTVRYDDGSEYETLRQPGIVSHYGKAVIIITLPSPVAMEGIDRVRYFRKAEDCNYCTAIFTTGWYGDITVPMKAVVGQPGGSQYGEETAVKLTKIGVNQLLVQPANAEAFPAGGWVRLEIDYGPSKENPAARGMGGVNFNTRL